MRQVTGKTNPESTANKVSIQLALDGHSFSVDGHPGTGGEPLTVEIRSPRTLLVPEALFAPERAELLLAADGKAPLYGEVAVWSEPADGMVAVMAVPKEVLAQVKEQAGPDRALHYTTPLCFPLNPSRPTAQVQYLAGYLYIKIYHAGLRLAEVLPAPEEADLRYVFERLEREFPARQFSLQLLGAEAHPIAKLVGKYYHDTRCE